MFEIKANWHIARLRDCIACSPEYGANASSVDYDHSLPRYIRITDITENDTLSNHNLKSIREEDAKGYIIELGDFLFARSGATVGKTYLHKSNNERAAYAGYLIRFKLNKKRLLPEFLEQFTKTDHYRFWIHSIIRAGAQPNINAQEYCRLEIPLPSINEQRQIVEILSTWDKAIEKTGRLIEEKILLHRAISQKLLSWNNPNSRLGSFLKSVSREIMKPNQSYWALGIRSHGKGTFRRLIEEPNEVSMNTLYRVYHDDLIVNITFAWEGAISLVKKEDEDCFVSHRFPTFEIIKTKVIPDYLKHVIIQKHFIHELGIISPGGAGRNRVLNKKDFLKLKIALPNINDQNRIGGILNTSQHEISLFEEKLENLKKQKRGLMQKIFTGKWRVKAAQEVT